MAPPLPGLAATLRLAIERFPQGARIAVLRDADVAARLAESKRFAQVDLLDAPAPADAIVALQPTRAGPLLRELGALHDALREGGLALVSDAVWQTAPTPELLKSFAPAPGAERIRPVEGYEMQIEHAGFEIEARLAFLRDDWLADLAPDDPRRGAVASDDRGALRGVAWLLRKTG